MLPLEDGLLLPLELPDVLGLELEPLDPLVPIEPLDDPELLPEVPELDEPL
ncbi:MAG TPA: hypothetical protein VFK90_08270 [Anaeromyxobacter sp.]|nr:hypothetical protein [Anaeromyxobacter sp.]